MTREPTTWRTSSFSSNGSNCVEVLERGDGTWMRDSKDRQGPALHCSAAHWRAFLAGVAEDDAPDHDTPGHGALRVRATDDGGRRVEDLDTASALRFTADEWRAFRRGVLAGEFADAGPSGARADAP